MVGEAALSEKYAAYPEYKDSGEEWLGQVPSHWKVIQIKHLSVVKRGASPRPIDDPKYFDDDGKYAWTRIADVTASDVYLTNAPQRLSDLGSSLSVKLEPEALFLSIAGTVGKPCITGIKACIHDGFVYFPDLKIPNKFLFYVFAGEQAYKGLGKFGTQLNLNTDTVGGIKIGCAPNDELESIIRFLDHETAKIDTLIDKQQQLIQLLKEKRQAVISHAVTKGLNPNAPMRDSGVEWLGEVPEHWEVSKVKFEYQNLDGRRIPLSTEERSYRQGDYPYYGASGIIDYVDDYIFDEGLVLVSEDGANLLARSSKIAFPAYGKYWVNNHAHILRPKDGNIDFWSEVIEVRDLTPYISGAAQPKFTSEALSNLVIAVPTCADEINQIAEYIRKQKEKYSNLINRADKSIHLMRERRTALISAAVTGKIDVRNWQVSTDNI